MIITIQECSSRGYCARGMKKFAEKHNLDWIKFVKEGIDEKLLKSTNDGMATDIIERIKYGRK